jgi:hypothetical protein
LKDEKKKEPEYETLQEAIILPTLAHIIVTVPTETHIRKRGERKVSVRYQIN